jgi:8-oxo-dGTP pyrophosphatase MutT (NUDIX family)
MTEPRLPRNASTVILIRLEVGGRFEVFMTRRPSEMEFLGGFYVFPGGSVRKDDWSEEMLSRCHGLSRTEAQRILGNELSPELSLGHWVAGIRELFEEVGILLCVTEAGGRLDMREGELQKRLAEKRKALVEGAMDFRVFLESEGLYCDLDRPVYFSHRVTPEKYSVRFDTRFYLARLPSDQSPLFSSQEVTESLWMTPELVLDHAEKNAFPVMPPTLAALRTLAAFDSWQSLCAQYQLR